MESDRRAAAVVRRNIEALGLGGPGGSAAQVSTADVPVVLRSGADQTYDVVLADPPYALGDDGLSAVLSALVSGGWLAPEALIVVERSARASPLTWPDGVFDLTSRRYGDTAVYYGFAP